jgi:hypothetical protein
MEESRQQAESKPILGPWGFMEVKDQMAILTLAGLLKDNQLSPRSPVIGVLPFSA